MRFKPKKVATQMGLAMIGTAIAAPFAPLGGAIGYSLGEYIFEENKENLNTEDLYRKYLNKILILTIGGYAGGWAGEVLGPFTGELLGQLSDIIPGDISETLLELIATNSMVRDSFDKLCILTKNSCLSQEAKAVLIAQYYKSVENVISSLINDEIIDEMIGRELIKNISKNLAVQNLLSFAEHFYHKNKTLQIVTN